MISFVAFPLVAALGVALLGSRGLGGLRPATAALYNAALLAAISVATVPTLWLIGLSGLAHVGVRNPIVDWSQHLLPQYAPLGAIVGIASLIAALTGTIRAGRALAHHRRLRCTDTRPLEFIETGDVFAYTLPGPARTIAISAGLREALDDDEFDFVLAHERAHARHRHDRIKLLALLTTAFVPPAAPVMARVDFHLERWADEEAIVDSGVERGVAARTIAKAALAGHSPHPALGIADHSIADRATALLEPTVDPGATVRVRASSIVACTLALAVFQIHHSVMFANHLIR